MAFTIKNETRIWINIKVTYVVPDSVSLDYFETSVKRKGRHGGRKNSLEEENNHRGKSE